MFTSMCEALGGSVIAMDWEERWPEIEKHRGCFYCPVTNDQTYPVRSHNRDGNHVRAHFSRKNNAALLSPVPKEFEFDDEYMRRTEDGLVFMRRESWQHVMGKQIAAENAPSFYEIGETAKRLFEYRVVLPTGKLRIADVAFVYPSGLVEVVEIQLSPISTEDLEARSNDYEDCGITCWWWFGDRANTRANFDWYVSRFGESPIILSGFSRDWDQSELHGSKGESSYS